MHRLAAALLLLAVTPVAAFAQALPVPSYWVNQRDSEMKLFSMDAKGAFKGEYIDHAAGFSCRNTPYDLTGQAYGRHLTFSVVWTNSVQDCKSKTRWIGRVDGKTMHTWWVLSPTKGIKIGKRVRGTDSFTQQ
jgi:hypothetical protein